MDEYEDGYCYLSIISHEYVASVKSLLGDWPTVDCILKLPVSYFKAHEQWKDMIMTYRGGVRGDYFHLCEVDEFGKFQFGEGAYNFFIRASQYDNYSIGTFGHSLFYKDYSYNPRFFRITIYSRVGGDIFAEHFGSFRPGSGALGDDLELCRTYYTALSLYLGKFVDGSNYSRIDWDADVIKLKNSVPLRLCEDVKQDSEASLEEKKPCVSVADRKDSDGFIRGLNYERNKANREQQKRRKQKKRMMQGKTWRVVEDVKEKKNDVQEEEKKKIVRGSLDYLLEPVVVKGHEGSVGNDVRHQKEKTDLQLSLEKKWMAENELAAEKASRQLAVLKANEIDAEVKRYGTNVRVATEKNMVAIEKSHSFLKSTDNVPKSEVDHDVHTVVDSVPGLTEGCTISPDSSASQSDFRKCQKDLLDSEERIRRFEAAFQKMGISLEAYEMKDKSEWTDTPENHAILDELYPYGYGEEYEYTKVKGKFNAIPCTDLSY